MRDREETYVFPITRKTGDVTAHFEVILKYKYTDDPVLFITVFRITDVQSGRKELVVENNLTEFLMFDNIYQGKNKDDFNEMFLGDVILGMLDDIIHKEENVKKEKAWLEDIVNELSDTNE